MTKRIKKYLIFLILLPIFAGIVYFGFIWYNNLETTLVNDTQIHLHTIAKSRAKRLENFIKNANQHSALLANEESMQEIIAQKLRRQEVFDKYSFYPNALFIDYLAERFEKVAIFDPNGILIDIEPLDKTRVGEDWSIQKDIGYVIKNKKPIITTVKNAFDENFYLVLTRPVFKNKKFIGIQRASIKTSSLADIFYIKERENSSHTYCWIIDEKENVLYHSSHPGYESTNVFELIDTITEPEKSKDLNNVFIKMLKGSSGKDIYTLSRLKEKDKRRIVGFHPIKIGDKNWSIAVSQEYSSISLPIKEHALFIFIASGIMIASTAVIGFGYKNLEKKESEIEVRKRSEAELKKEIKHRIETEHKLKHHIELETLVSHISARFINLSPDEIDSDIYHTLGLIGKFSDADRTFLIQFDTEKKYFTHTHEWVRKENFSLKKQLQEKTLNNFPWFKKIISKGLKLNCRDISLLGKRADTEKKFWQKMGIKSVLFVPMIYNNQIKGCLGLNSFETKKNWPKDIIELLQIVGAVCATAIEKKKAEEQLKKSEARYRTLAQNYPKGAVTLFDKDIRFILAGGKILKEINLSRKKLVGTKFKEILPAKTYQIAEKYYKAAFKGEENSFEIPYQDKIFRITTLPLKDYNGNIICGMAISNDITDRKKTEAELKKSEKRYRLLFEKTEDGLALHKIIPGKNGKMDDYKFLNINPAFEKFIGLKKKEIIDRNVNDILPQVEDSWKLVYNKISVKGTNARFENYSKRLDKYFEIITYSPETDQFVTVVRDITVQKQIEDQIRRYNQELEKRVLRRTKRIKELQRQRTENEKLAATGRMAARIAHEINNPLGGVKNSFHLIKDAVPENHKYYDYVERIDKEIKRMANIIKQLYSLYRPNQEPPKKFAVYDCIRDIVYLQKAKYTDRKLNIKIQAPEDCKIVMQEALLRQILFNLTQNSIEATRDGKDIIIKASKNNNYLEIEVINEGSEIPDNLKERIFEPLFTTKKRTGNDGLGVGLSVCKKIIDALGGNITYKRKDGKYTVFSFTIPLTKKEQSINE